MDLWSGRWRRVGLASRSSRLFFLSICFFTLCALIADIGSRTVYLDIRSSSDRRPDLHTQWLEEEEYDEESSRIRRGLGFGESRRYLSGPGSYPPRCMSKCGKCTPCKPVHVPVPPGTPVTTEYYPEAWRCKCGNKLYMP